MLIISFLLCCLYKVKLVKVLVGVVKLIIILNCLMVCFRLLIKIIFCLLILYSLLILMFINEDFGCLEFVFNLESGFWCVVFIRLCFICFVVFVIVILIILLFLFFIVLR